MRLGSLCSGYGGLDLAAENVTGASLAWVVEHDPQPSRILAHHWPGVPNHGDVWRTDWRAVEPVDVLTAGYPCQPFSNAGRRRGSDDPRHLWPGVAAAIGALRPGVVILENVSGHVSLGLADVLGDLSGLGYDAAWSVVRAADAGAPHNRARVFIVAAPTDAGSGQQPRPAPAWHRFPVAPERGDSATPDPGHVGSVPAAEGAETGRQAARVRSASKCRVDAVREWGRFAPAIERWARVVGRAAPPPVEDGRAGPRLAAPFVEWMMGLPAGHVTDPGIGLSRPAQLKALGNGVVPQQAALALSVLIPRLAGVPC